MQKIILCFTVFLYAVVANAQHRCTVSGKLRTKSKGESIIGASVGRSDRSRDVLPRRGYL